MDRREPIIRLGRSKSPRRFQNTTSSFHQKTESFNSSRTSRDKEPFQESQNFNQTLNEKNLRMAKSHVFQGAQTHSGFFPPSPEKVLQRVIVKENIRSPVNNQFLIQSPGKTVVIGRVLTSENSPRLVQAPVPIISDKEIQLERKVKVLEGRIKELHNEKQGLVVKSHEENKRLCFDNQMLQGKIGQVEQIKNQEIFYLRQENERLRAATVKVDQMNQIETKSRVMAALESKEPEIEQSKIIVKQNEVKNAPYYDDEEVTSINNEKENCEDPMKDRIKELETQNVQLRENLEEMKEAIIQTSAIIEQNNQKIIEDYESRVQSLLEELDYCRNEMEEHQGIKSKFELSQKTCEAYASKLLAKSSELTKKEEECEELKKSLTRALSLAQESSEPILIDYEDEKERVFCQEKSLAIKIEECEKLRKQLEEIEHPEPQISLDEIDSLTEMMEDLSRQVQDRDEKLLLAENRVKELESKIENQSSVVSSQESCEKCQSLMKAFTKLKSKTYARTV